jgi:hypothetical protein
MRLIEMNWSSDMLRTNLAKTNAGYFNGRLAGTEIKVYFKIQELYDNLQKTILLLGIG